MVASTLRRGRPGRPRSWWTRCADGRQRFGKVRHALVLVFVADLAPLGVVAALLAPFGIAAGGLQVAVGVG